MNRADSFHVGQIWLSPKNTAYRVVSVVNNQAALTQFHGVQRRTIRRPWDAVVNWTLIEDKGTPMTTEQIEQHRKRFEELFASEFSYKSDPDYGTLEIIRGGKVLTTWCYADDPNDGFIEYRDSAFEGYLLCAENMPEIHLPLRMDESQDSDLYDDGYNACLDDCKIRIQNQGYTVKTL